MINQLIKCFVKDYDHVEYDCVRQRYGNLCSVVGLICNIFLSAGKFIVGFLSGSVSIIADAANNLSDAGNSLISLVSFKLSGKPADKEHPFGHARIEYIAAMIVAFLIITLGIELGKQSIDKILHPQMPEFYLPAVIVLVLSILVKLWLFALNRHVGKKIASDMLSANAVDSLSDVMATGAVLLSTLISPLVRFSLDGYMGIVVAVLVLIGGVKIVRETFNHLVGEGADADQIRKIQDHILGYPGVLGIHDLTVHSYGTKCYATVHIEVEAGENSLDSHDLIDNIERDLLQNTGIHLVGHMDPLQVNNAYVDDMRKLAQEVIVGVDPALTLHDFRVVKGETHSNLIFDITAPFELKLSDEELSGRVAEEIQKRNPSLFAVVTVDRG